MTVGELVEILKKCPQDHPVVIEMPTQKEDMLHFSEITQIDEVELETGEQLVLLGKSSYHDDLNMN